MKDREPMGFTSAMKDFFGLKNGQTLKDFSNEAKALTEQDKAEIKVGLEKLGYIIK